MKPGKKMSQATFEGMCWAFEMEAGQYIPMEVYDDYRPVGLAVSRAGVEVPGYYQGRGPAIPWMPRRGLSVAHRK